MNTSWDIISKPLPIHRRPESKSAEVYSNWNNKEKDTGLIN